MSAITTNGEVASEKQARASTARVNVRHVSQIKQKTIYYLHRPNKLDGFRRLTDSFPG
jgi:hypothetical protein